MLKQFIAEPQFAYIMLYFVKKKYIQYFWICSKRVGKFGTHLNRPLLSPFKLPC